MTDQNSRKIETGNKHRGSDQGESIPFDEALRKLVNTPPKPKAAIPKDWPQDDTPGDPNDPRCPSR